MSQFQKDPWLLAEKRYLDGLTAEERALFESATVENLFYSTSAAQIRHRDSSKSRDVARRLQPFTAAITQYGSAVDVFANASSLVLCPLWGSIRVVLHIASEFNKYYSKLVDMLERIGDVIHRFKAYERLFPTQERLLHSLSLVYLDVIKFCVQAKNMFQKAKKDKSILPRSGLRAMKILWKPFKEDFGEVIERFRQHAENVEREAQLSHMIESNAEREAQGNEREAQALERANMKTKQERKLLVRREKDRKGLLQRLSTYNYELKHRQIARKRHPDTGKWIWNSNEFSSWVKETSSSCLWCYGIPGSGKSVLTATVIDTIKSNHVSNGALLAYYYCDYSNPKTLETREILGSLIKQFLDQRKIPHGIESQLETICAEGRVPDVEELFEAFLMVVQELPKTFVAVDGLDECREKDREYFLPWLKKLASLSQVVVKLFIASREEVDIKKVFADGFLIAATPENVSADISSVVEDIVKTKVEEEKICVRDPCLVREIIDALVKGAQGMFLWVAFQIDDICEEPTEDGVRSALKRLPVGLNETYTRALTKILVRGKSQADMACKAFRWMVYAKRTLSLEELQEAVAIDISDKSLNRCKVPGDLQLIRACGNLAVYDTDEKAIRLAHYTVRQFFLSPPASNDVNVSAQLANFYFRSESAAYPGIICVTYLMFSDFETQVAQRKTLSHTQALLLNSPTTQWVSSMVSSSKIQSEAWNIFQRTQSSSARRNLNINFDRHLCFVEKPSGVLQQRYQFLNYVIDYWVEHACSNFYPEGWDTAMQASFEKLVLERKMLFNFRPWGESYLHEDPPYHNLFRWAVESGKDVLVAIVLDAGLAKGDPKLRANNERLYWNCKVGDGESPFSYASRFGYSGIVNLFLNPQGFLSNWDGLTHGQQDAKSIRGTIESALHNGQQDIVLNLLNSLNSRCKSSISFTSVLRSAAKRGFVEVIDLLGQSQIIEGNEEGLKSLHLASKHGHLESVRALMGFDFVDIDEESTDDSTAIYLAAKFGHDKIVGLLLPRSRGGSKTLHLLNRLLAEKEYRGLNILLEQHELLRPRTHLRVIISSGDQDMIRYVLDRKSLEFGESGLPHGFEHAMIKLAHTSPRGVVEVLKWAQEKNMLSAVAQLLPTSAEKNDEELVNALLTLGVDVDTQNAEGWTPICLAARNGHEWVVRALLASGASTNAVVVSGEIRSPLTCALKGGHRSVVELLEGTKGLQEGPQRPELDHFFLAA